MYFLFIYLFCIIIMKMWHISTLNSHNCNGKKCLYYLNYIESRSILNSRGDRKRLCCLWDRIEIFRRFFFLWDRSRIHLVKSHCFSPSVSRLMIWGCRLDVSGSSVTYAVTALKRVSPHQLKSFWCPSQFHRELAALVAKKKWKPWFWDGEMIDKQLH